MKNREYVKYLMAAKSGIQKFLFSEETLQQEKDRIIEELARINNQIQVFRGKNPDEEADIIKLEFNSKIQDLWLSEKKTKRLLSNSLSKEEITGLR